MDENGSENIRHFMDREDSNPDITKKKEDKEERCILFSLGEWITKSKRNNFL
jgi:hypothetical protein